MEHKLYQLTIPQKSILDGELYFPEETFQNIGGYVIFNQHVSMDRLNEAYNILLKQYDAYRIRLTKRDGSYGQYIVPYEPETLELQEFTGREEEFGEFLKAFRRRILFQCDAPLYQMTAVKIPDGRIGVALVIHHMIADGYTLIQHGLTKILKLCISEDEEMHEAYSYTDFIEAQEIYQESEEKKKDAAFWEQKISEYSGEAAFAQVTNLKCQNLFFRVNKTFSDEIREFCRNHGVSVYHLFLGAVLYYKSSITHNKSVVVGTPILNRKNRKEKETMGMYVNTLPMFLNMEETWTVLDLLKKVKGNAFDLFRHQKYSYHDIRSRYGEVTGELQNLMEILVSYQNVSAADSKISALDYELKLFEHDTTMDVLQININDYQNTGSYSLEYKFQCRQFTQEEMQLIHRRLLTIVKEFMLHPDSRVSDCAILDEEEEKLIVHRFNDTKEKFPEAAEGKTVMDLFEEQAAKTPELPAVLFDERSMTYREFNQRVNSLAHRLKDAGIGPDDMVPVIAHRSFEMMIGIYAVLKAGGAYVPVSPNYPEARVQYIVKDCGAKIVLTNQDLSYTLTVPLLDLRQEKVDVTKVENPVRVSGYKNLAYVIYTSGTTGQPKGVMIEHGALMNRLLWMQKAWPIGEGDVILQKTTYTFDVSVWEIIWWSQTGAAVSLLRQGGEMVPEEIADCIQKTKVTTMHFVPSMLEAFLASAAYHPENIKKSKSLKQVFASGEALKPEHVKRFLELFGEEGDTKLVNLYGPTEAAIDVTCFVCDHPYPSIPIGKPISNIQLYIVDQENHLMPVGVSGELCIAGVGLGRGYLNNQELTDRIFVPNPFGPGRMYRTKDVAKWMPDGNITYLGRMDEQVKIRGFRIELNEIASVINSLPNVRTCAVITKQDASGSRQIYAYVVSEQGPLDMKEIQSGLEQKVPDYMIPSGMMQIDEIPVTQNGKVNKKALPDIIAARLTEYIPPKNPIETDLCEIFSEVLNVAEVGINDNFFELGGDSIKAIHIVSKCQGKGYVLSIKDILLNKTIEKIALCCTREEKEEGRQYIGGAGWYKTSASQKRMYLAQLKNKESIFYNVPDYVAVPFDIEPIRLEECMRQLMERHEILRTTFHIVDGEIMQHIHPFEETTFQVEQIILSEGEDTKEVITSLNRPYDLEQLPLFRVTLVKEADGKTVLVLNQHHIITDHTSFTILEEELLALYNGNTLQEPANQYRDFVAWENSMDAKKMFEREERYWLNKFSGKLPHSELPLDYKRSMEPDNAGATYTYELDEKLLKRLKEFSKKHNSTLFGVMFAAYNILLSRLTNEKDMIVGVPVNNRRQLRFERMLGVFLNTLAIRTLTAPEQTFVELLEEVNKNLLEAMENQDYQFEELIEHLNIRPQPNRTPLFDCVMNYIFYRDKLALLEKSQFEMLRLNMNIDSAKFDITMYMFDCEEQFRILCNYRKHLFREETIHYFIGEYVRLLKQICENADIPIGDYTLFERKLPHTYKVLDKEGLGLVKTFEQIAYEYGNKAAVRTLTEEYTYQELNERANAVAEFILSQEKTDAKVGLVFKHGAKMIAALLGALKAGAIFIPLDPTYPEERLSYMLKDSETDILIADQENYMLAEKLAAGIEKNLSVCCMGEGRKQENPVVSYNKEQIAYIMYTSGSTGQPKGVIQTHENILAFMKGYCKDYGITSSDRVSLLASYSHATGMIDIFAALLSGATICPYDIKNEGSMEHLLSWLEQEEITVYHSVPSVYRYLLRSKEVENKTSIRLIVLGGESITAGDVKLYKEHFSKDCVFVNLFGSSEVLVAAGFKIAFDTELSGQTVPIGYLVDEADCYILDEQGKEQGVYGIGEMVYASPYLAKGYWKLEDKTKQVFTKNPVTGEGMVYRSGDLGRLLPDGHFEYLGRKDFQVKIRGYRIEVDEIEGILDEIEGIEKSVVLAKQNDQGEYYLAAFYKAVSEDISEEMLKTSLKKTVPGYMVPSYFMPLKEIPFTPNGKIDRQAVKEMPVYKVFSEGAKPRNELDEKLMGIWQEILEVPVNGIEDNFFELGGHSLNVTLLAGRIQKEWNAQVSIKEIFAHGILWQLSDFIAQKIPEEQGTFISLSEYDKKDEIYPIEEREWYVASASQTRMYLTNQMNEESTAYNVPNVLDIDGEIDVEHFKNSLYSLIKRHEALRTGFQIVDGVVMQKIYPFEEIKEKIEIKEFTLEDTDEAKEEMLEHFVRPFDLGRPPLIRLGIGKTGNKKYSMFFDLHHIICDGTSVEIMTADLSKIYNGVPLEPLKVTYKDYAAWQQRRRKNRLFLQDEAFWLEEFKTPPAILNLPVDFKRPEVRSDEGAVYYFTIPQKLKEKINHTALDTKTTLFMVLLAGLNITLSKYCHQEEITVGTAIAGRTQPALENLVGVFINTLAIKSTLDWKVKVSNYLMQLKEQVLNVYEHQEYPFDELVEKAGVLQDASRAPFIEILFLLQNMKGEKLILGNADMKLHPFKKISTKFDLSLEATETDAGIHIKTEYSTALLKESSVQKFAEYWMNVLEQITREPEMRIKDIILLTKEEAEQMNQEMEEPDISIEFDF